MGGAPSRETAAPSSGSAPASEGNGEETHRRQQEDVRETSHDTQRRPRPLPRPSLGSRPTNPVPPAMTDELRSMGLGPGFGVSPFGTSRSRDVIPPPVTLHAPVQQRGIVTNVVNLRKSTLRVLPADTDPNILLVEFAFDAQVDGYITVYYAATPVVQREGRGEKAPIKRVSFVGLREAKPSKTRFEVGPPRVYRQKVDKGLNIRKYAPDELVYMEGVDRYPLVIRLEAIYPEGSQVPAESRVLMQTTFATLNVSETEPHACTILRQEVLVSGTIYRIHELYGIAGDVKAQRTSDNEGATNATDTDDRNGYALQTSHECVICLTEPASTAVLPCNHMCLCDDCAERIYREQDVERRRCPMCRSPLGGLLRIISNPPAVAAGQGTVPSTTVRGEGSGADSTYVGATGDTHMREIPTAAVPASRTEDVAGASASAETSVADSDSVVGPTTDGVIVPISASKPS